MKIAHLIDSGGMYGAEQVVLTLCEEQLALGVEVQLVSCGLPDELEKPIEKVAVERNIPVVKWRMEAGLNLRGARKLLSYLEQNGFNIVHSHGYKFNILLGLLKGQFNRFKYVSTVHGYVKAKLPSKMWLYELIDRVMLKRFDRVVLVSPQMYEFSAFKSLGQKSTVITNGIKFSHDSITTDSIVRERRMLAVGRLSPEKGFSFLIDAFVRAAEVDDTISLDIIGEGGMRNTLEEKIRLHGLQDKVRLLGFVADGQSLFYRYDLLVMPSLTEGIPVTLLEAMRNRIGVIASNVGGIPFVMGQDYEGLFTAGSVESLASAISHWTSLSDARKDELIQHNFEKFQSNFTSISMCNNYLNLYHSFEQ